MLECYKIVRFQILQTCPRKPVLLFKPVQILFGQGFQCLKMYCEKVSFYLNHQFYLQPPSKNKAWELHHKALNTIALCQLVKKITNQLLI